MLFLNLKMSKKRKTRQEKIILQLKRELAKKTQVSPSISTKSKPRQGAILKPAEIEPEEVKPSKKTDISILSFDQELIRRDLLKSLILSLAVISLEFVLYLVLR